MNIGKWSAVILAYDTTEKKTKDIVLQTQNFLFDLSLACYYAGRYCEYHEMKYSSEEFYTWWRDFHKFLDDCGYFKEEEEDK